MSNKDLFIPEEILLLKDLSLTQKAFLARINNSEFNNCSDSNEDFAQFFQLSKTRCSQIINSLKNMGLISMKYEKIDKQIVKREVCCKLNRGIKDTVEYKKSIPKGISPSIINIKKLNKESCKKNTLVINRIVKYLNRKLQKNYKTNSSQTIQKINGRIRDGYGWKDFKYVIDVKYTEWKDTEFEKYINPSTLFRPSNFEKYLNQKKIQKVNIRYYKLDENNIKTFEDENKEEYDFMDSKILTEMAQ